MTTANKTKLKDEIHVMVRLRRDTRDALAEFGSKKDTYDMILQRLIKAYGKNRTK